MTPAFPPTGKVRLRTNLADHPVARALKDGTVKSDLVEFDFCGPTPANRGFKPMIREGAYDAGELAIGSFLQAKVYGKPLVLLPAVVMARFQHHTIVYNASKGELGPKDLEGRRVAVRSYTQTTGIWVRGILKHEHGVDLSRLRWVCTDDAHLAEYRDPATLVERPGSSAKPLDRMLIDGDVDAAIPAGDLTKDHPHIRHLFPNPNEHAKAWVAKYGTVPVNHYMVVSKALADTRPDAVRAIYRMLQESKALAPPPDDIDFFPYGVEANRKALDLMAQYAVEQQIIPRAFTVDELFADAAEILDRA
jgi:4,5-dihydroxyphthalate decarboxylase